LNRAMRPASLHRSVIYHTIHHLLDQFTRHRIGGFAKTTPMPKSKPGKTADRAAPTAARSLTDEIYRILKWQILSTELVPGTLLNEQSLVESTGFGRGPIHQALHRLQYDGLVEIRPRKGAQVRTWSPRDLGHLMEARLPLECAVARLAALRARQDELRQLRQKLDAGPALLAAQDREGLMRLDQEFHEALARFAQSPILAELVENLHHRSAPLWYLPISGRQVYEDVLQQHEQIMSAIERGDAEAAAQAMTDHLSTLQSSFR
jgi:DNA-binding GntR family transcriptional regulator